MQGSLINGPGWQAERVMVVATACQTIGTLARMIFPAGREGRSRLIVPFCHDG
ncbi:hypothetical protein [Serratia proteamaculans]|uniref:hypothetical protein n=1 Tax=Serratia proteamaculans TaxID=28151 RepID=UPI0014325764|nr:hypothetical protein [Serratia proteamaculans]